MDSFSNPADFLMDITNGEAVSALVTPSAGTKNRTGSGGSSEYKNIKMVQMLTFLHLSIAHASSRPCCHHGLCLTNCNAMQVCHFILCHVSTTECKNPLALRYQQSQVHRNVLEELEHKGQMEMEGVKGQDMVANYVTSFFYQVTLKKQQHSNWFTDLIKKTCIKH